MVLPRTLSFAGSLRSHRLLQADVGEPRPPCRSRRRPHRRAVLNGARHG